MENQQLIDSSYQEDFNGGSIYYSIIPTRAQAHREKYKHWGRRLLFYLMLAYFITATIMFPFLITNLTFWFWLIHILYFELDLTTSKNNIFVHLLHPLSFVGSFVVMITSIILLVILNPDFIASRAEKEHHSVGFAWTQNILIHWLPPLFLIVDLLIHQENIRKRHRIRLSKERNTPRVWIRDILKVVWIVASPMIVVGIWFGSGFTIEKVYGVTNYNLSYLIPSMVVLDIIVAIIFIFRVKIRDDLLIRLNP